MVTIVTDMLYISTKTCIFLKKKREKSSKMLKIGLENRTIPLFLPPNRAFWGQNTTGKKRNSTKNRKKQQKLVEVEKCTKKNFPNFFFEKLCTFQYLFVPLHNNLNMHRNWAIRRILIKQPPLECTSEWGLPSKLYRLKSIVFNNW